MSCESELFLLIHTDTSFTSTVLGSHDRYESAISSLSEYMNGKYDTKNYRIVQKSKNLFEVYQMGYFGRYLIGKYMITQYKKC